VAFLADAGFDRKARLSLVRMARRFWHSPAAAKSASSQPVQRLSDQKIKTVLTDLVYRGHGYVGQAMIPLVGQDFKKMTAHL